MDSFPAPVIRPDALSCRFRDRRDIEEPMRNGVPRLLRFHFPPHQTLHPLPPLIDGLRGYTEPCLAWPTKPAFISTVISPWFQSFLRGSIRSEAFSCL